MSFDTVNRLKDAHLMSFAAKRAAHKAIMERVCADFYRANERADRTMRNAEYLAHFADAYPVEIAPDEQIVGTMWHWGANARVEGVECVPDHTNIGHYIADFGFLVQNGVPGLLATAENLPAGDETVPENRAAYIVVLNAFLRYMARYADEARRLAGDMSDAGDRARLTRIAEDCRLLCEGAPRTFRQALQLVWFAQTLLETESCAAANSYGRMDQYLFPFLRAGEADDALEAILCFYIKNCEGDESAMITVGGGGADNALSVLLLKAQTMLNMRQPSLSVRVDGRTSDALWDAANALAKVGGGMPGYINDDKVIPGLLKIGVDETSARDYGIVGCYEAAPQGALANTVAAGVNLYDAFDAFWRRDGAYADFDAFKNAFFDYFDEWYRTVPVPNFRKTLEWLTGGRSPLAGCLLRGGLSSGLLPEQYGCDYTLFGIDMLNIGVLIDSLYAIKKLVFEEKFVSLAEYRAQTDDEFSGARLYNKIRALEGAYGSDDPESDCLAAEASRKIGETVRKYPLDERVLMSPALFVFTADIWQRNCPATANGRRRGELLSYGVMPCAAPRAQAVTSMLASAAHVESEYFPDGCPLMISLAASDARRIPDLVTRLVKTYFAAGGFHFAVNFADAETLERAKDNPRDYANLMVKISGYSARFTGLCGEIQDAVIERARVD